MVVATSLRRMGHEQRAKKVMRLAYGVALTEAVILALVSGGVVRLVGLVGEIGFLLFFPPLMEKEFKEWRAAHPDVEASDGLNAISVGLAGTVIFGTICFVVGMALAIVFPHKS